MSVYFITNREQNVCKIGVARNVKARLASLQTASPAKLTLEAALPGSVELEQDLHARFSACRLKGEWFAITDELDALIKETAASVVIPFPEPAPEPANAHRLSEEELIERSNAQSRRMLEEAMRDFERAGCVASDAPPEQPRFYRPVPASGGQFAQHYAIRAEGQHRLLCTDLNLTWDQADRLCDVFEEVRRKALDAAVVRSAAA